MRLLACLIIAPQRGYDQPAILSYAISSFCPTNADGLHSAVAIAAAAKERVIVLAPQGSDARESVVERAEAAGVRIEAGPVIQEPWDVSSLLTQLAHPNERLLVMSRGTVPDKCAPTIASLRGVPILLARAISP
jgi:hypothetical protein